ncbi:MAG: hypothetical protein KKI14_00310 [Nanoarchaeota archaeon]|nr:hypothetical protein [Nanoarchaeota archaeon]
MPDFVPVLTIAIITMMALILMFGGIIEFTDTDTHYYNDTDDNAERIYLGENFSVADFRMGTAYASLSGRTENGIFSKATKSMSFDARTLDRAEYGLLTLKINDTNVYGPLIIAINDNIIFNEPTLVGEHNIKFDKSILDDTENKIIVTVGSSGWRLWAPTVYQFEVKISGETKDIESKITKFKLDEVPDDTQLKVYIDEKEGPGDLIVKINGYRVFKGQVNGFKDFDPFILREGTNTAEITAEYGSRYDVDSVYIELE